MLRNLLFRLRYRGTRYHGFQMQKNALSVCDVLSDAVIQVTGSRHSIIGCSRTDTGVHANEYYWNMKTECSIPPDAFVRALNVHLPEDIAVTHCREVPMDFHARFCAREKEYVYRILNVPVRDPFCEDTALHYKYPLNDELLAAAASRFVGEHDFSAFCSAGSSVQDTVRTIYDSRISREGDLVLFTVRGNGFLYNMVRILVGTMLEASEGKIPLEAIEELFCCKDRGRAGRTAPPQGLFLNRVFYDEDWFGLSESPLYTGNKG